jgi:Carbohydrate esterase, sialic acid-specific acetylesterase
MTPLSYQHAIDSGVYLIGVDSSDASTRVPADPSEIGASPVFLIIGQSNAASHGETRFAASRPVFNFNLFDGLCYPASDPLLGTTGDGGSPWCLLADALIAEGFASSILLCPFAVGGSTVAEWAPGGTYQHRLGYGLQRLRDAGFEPSHVLWHQGEADALYGTAADDYTNSFRSLVKSLREEGIKAPFYAATATYFAVPQGYAACQAVIRSAQQANINPENGILPGPDTDQIRDRFDGCHMGTAGLREHAEMWRACLRASRHT